ncbi:NUDIX hydrolase [Kitasatospora sp. NPDC088783]|uniref:NUDIX hydrolase n=1 Tax=Kitasatospora sp. NPDC088783 TaxID=3364077 RepID=UPI00381B09A0
MNGTPSVRIRVGVLLLHHGQVLLIHRRRPGGLDQHTLPGGLTELAESTWSALARELAEELLLDATALPNAPVLRWIQDQATTRPGGDLLRRRHLIHLLHLPDAARADREQDADDTTRTRWIPLRQAARLHLYSAVAPALTALAAGTVPARAVRLPAMDDRTYAWR